jgi:cupin 2 domain-containing protein
MNMPDFKNLLAEIPEHLPKELVEVLASAPGVRIERIVSQGHCSPDGFWYDQDENEFVVLLSGAARLLFEGETKPVEMKPGSFVNIAAHRRHRVEWTDPSEKTVWLAVFY